MPNREGAVSPGRDFVERIWAAMYTVREDRIDPTKMVVHVAPDVWMALKVEDPLSIMTRMSGGEVRVFGLRMTPDQALPDGAIRLRWEVEA